MNERWLPIAGYEGLYEVSDHGRVRSMARHVVGPKKRQTVGARVMASVCKDHRYMTTSLYKDGVGRHRYVHRLVLSAFIGPAPAGMHGCHNNGVKTDNRLSNLRWDTPLGNHSDRKAHGTLRNGEQARAAKLTADEVLRIRSLLSAGVGQPELATLFGIKQPTVSDIKSRRTWKHI